MISWLTAPLLPETVAAYTATIDHTLRTKLHKVVVVCNTSRHKVLVEEEEDEKKKKEEEKGGSRKEEEKKPLIAKLIGRRRLVPFVCGAGPPSSLPNCKYGARYVASYLQQPQVRDEENATKTDPTFALIGASPLLL
ncbi:hypothetical protein MTR67_014120 [Solanum verrucosum]|uniref:Uncharacterized protein n=1 Tax=Solanum verrucosum TaxID=315347 RepID=A0AAF0QEC8_SOLVR|nr:hypothetical protein MTR67_014120 [Solanum verrucosum]